MKTFSLHCFNCDNKTKFKFGLSYGFENSKTNTLIVFLETGCCKSCNKEYKVLRVNYINIDEYGLERNNLIEDKIQFDFEKKDDVFFYGEAILSFKNRNNNENSIKIPIKFYFKEVDLLLSEYLERA